MRLGLLGWIASLFFLVPGGSGAALAPEKPQVFFGGDFPEVSLPVPPLAAERAYLGLKEEVGDFAPSRIEGELVLVELLNVYCPHCQMQTAAYNELFRLIESDPATRGRIKLLGIAVGNHAEEVALFRERFQLPYPVVADPDFKIHRKIGGGATPYTIYLRQTSPGQPGVVAGTHLGLNTHYQKLFKELKKLVRTDPDSLRQKGREAEKVRTAITPLFTEEELQYRVRNAFIATGGRIDEFAPVELPSGRRVYSAAMVKGEQRQPLFAEVVSRLSICDVCHDVHFIYVFDPSGNVVGFAPLQLTRWGNVNWTSDDIEKMKQRLIGKNLSQPFRFDPKVDAVTSATISSSIIFDGLRQGEQLLMELRDKGLVD